MRVGNSCSAVPASFYAARFFLVIFTAACIAFPAESMKALLLKEYKQFSFEDVPAPEPGPDEVLVAVKACGICGSDVHGMDGSTGRRRPPIIMGHEAAGVIADIGTDVTAWKVGDR